MLKTKLISNGFILFALLVLNITMQAADTKKPVSPIHFNFTDTALPFSPYDSVLFMISGIEDAEIFYPTIQLNKQAKAFTEPYLAINGKMLEDIKQKNPGYFKIMDAIFSKKGLPVELKYLAIIESKLKTKAISRVGAVGAWQFMPATARFLKLKVNSKQDDRKNFYKSTQAAAIYLSDLYNMFGDWLLVLAAYNSGPGTVMKAIQKTGTRDFWKLQYALPKETRDHVKKYISTHYYYEGTGGITTITKNEIIKHEKEVMAYNDYIKNQTKLNHMLETAMILTLPAEKISITDNILPNESLSIPEIYLTKL